MDAADGKHALRAVFDEVKKDRLKVAVIVGQFCGPAYARAADYLSKLEWDYFLSTSETAASPWLEEKRNRAVPDQIFDLRRCFGCSGPVSVFELVKTTSWIGALQENAWLANHHSFNYKP